MYYCVRGGIACIAGTERNRMRFYDLHNAAAPLERKIALSRLRARAREVSSFFLIMKLHQDSRIFSSVLGFDSKSNLRFWHMPDMAPPFIAVSSQSFVATDVATGSVLFVELRDDSDIVARILR